MKKVLIINGHPDAKSLNKALADEYFTGAANSDQQVEVDRIDIGELAFDPNLRFGYGTDQAFEPDLRSAVDKIKEADHLVWFFPTWWQGFPAVMKGFIDRTFLPGIAYRFQKGEYRQQKLFKGKTARIVVTSDTPGWYNRLIMGSLAINQLKKATLEFCGVSPVKVTHFSPVRNSDEKRKKKWLVQVRKLGEQVV